MNVARSSLSIAFVALLLGSVLGPASAGEPKMFLSWHAPFGLPGAVDTLSRASGDTTIVDTLYVSFDPGRSTRSFIGITASLNFRGVNPDAPGDSLSPAWNPAGGSSPPRLMRVEFPLDPPATRPSPWRGNGFSMVSYKRATFTGELRLVYAVSFDAAAPADSGSIYTFARIALRRPEVAAWCRQPVCIEWAQGSFAYSPTEEPTFDRGGERFASLNSRGGQICAPWKASGSKAPASVARPPKRR